MNQISKMTAALCALCVGVLLHWGARAAPAATPLVRSVESIGVPVADADRSIRFYSQVLGFHTIFDHEVSGDAYEHLFGVFGMRLRVVRMQLGEEFIDLMQFLIPHGRPMPADSRSNDRWFEHLCIVVGDMDQAFGVLRSHAVTFGSPGPQLLPAWNPGAGGIAAFYFKDPDGNNLEILHFPADKGAAKWHQARGSLFMGIDHSAIVIAHTADSLRYYRDFLGFSIVGQSDNYGPEQERLNNVFGARLHITSLRSSAGPGLELLEYVTPRGGRAYPNDTVAADLWQWVVNMRVQKNTALESTEHFNEQSWISNGVIEFKDKELGYGRAFMLRDPDGHAANLTLGPSAE